MKLLVWLIIALSLISSVSALGLISPPLGNKTLEILEDQSALFRIGIQNAAGPDMNVTVSVSGIARILDEQPSYYLPSGTTYYEILLNVTPPKYAKVGDYFGFSVSLGTASASGGQVPFRTGISKSFQVRIIEDKSKLHINYYLSYIGVVLALIIVAAGVFKYFIKEYNLGNERNVKKRSRKKVAKKRSRK